MPDTTGSPEPQSPWIEQVGHMADVSTPVTRNIIALAVIYGFLHLSFIKEISGDSFTNVVFVVIGWAFGKMELAGKSTNGSPRTNGMPTNGAVVPPAVLPPAEKP